MGFKPKKIKRPKMIFELFLGDFFDQEQKNSIKVIEL
jgi:hypothetical protein